MSEGDLGILALTLRVGLLATLLCLPFAIGIGYGLARHALPLPSLLRALISLPVAFFVMRRSAGPLFVTVTV